MKLRLIISILFILATTFTALHEIEHVKNHDSFTCQICIVDDHTTSADVVDTFEELVFFSFNKISSQHSVSYFNNKNHSYQTRAPPKIS